MDTKTGQERAVIGTLLIDFNHEITAHLMDELEPQDFSDGMLRELFAIIKALYKLEAPINMVTVMDRGEFDIGYLSQLTEEGFIQNARFVCNGVKTASVVRQLREKAESIITGMSAEQFESPNEAVEHATRTMELKVPINTKRKERFADIFDELFDELEKEKKNISMPMTFGMRDLDWNTGGIRKSEVTIVAAGPGIGKTAFAMNIAVNVAKTGRNVLLVSREMNRIQCAKRVIANMASIDAEVIRDGRGMNEDAWTLLANVIGTINKTPLFIDDTSTTIQEICNKCRRLKESGGVDILILDYLQLLISKDKHESRRHEIEHISRQLKMLSLELELPIIALSQLSREGRRGVSPKLTDLRESGALEQDADNVIFLYDKDEETNRANQIIPLEIIVAKQRNGRTGTAHMIFQKKYQRFVGVER